MQINGAHSIHGAQQIKPAAKNTVAQSGGADNIFQPNDSVEFSSEANWMNQINDLPDVRADRVADLRSQIQSGNYETAEKMSVALDRLLDDFG